MLRDPTAPIDGAINGNGKESKGNAGLAARLSSANLASKHIIDKRINKMLFNMHGIPVQPNVTNQQQQQQNKQKKNKKEQKELEKLEKLEKEKQEKQEKQDKKGNRKRKQMIEQHV